MILVKCPRDLRWAFLLSVLSKRFTIKNDQVSHTDNFTLIISNITLIVTKLVQFTYTSYLNCTNNVMLQEKCAQ